MSTPALRHWSRQSRMRLNGGLLITFGLAGLLAAQLLLGKLGGRRFAMGLIPIGIGGLMLAYGHWRSACFGGGRRKRPDGDIPIQSAINAPPPQERKTDSLNLERRAHQGRPPSNSRGPAAKTMVKLSKSR